MHGTRFNISSAVIFLLIIIGVTSAERNYKNAERIVGQSDNTAHITKFPHQVSVRRRLCTACTYDHYCGGLIYTPTTIITAVNCVRNAEALHTQIVAGTSYRGGAAKDGRIYPVEKFIIHEDDSIDLALIQLAIPMDLNGLSVEAAILATELPRPGQLAIIAGWGQVQEFVANSEELKEAQVPLIDHEACKLLYNWHGLTDNELCAGYSKGGSDACQGDAGSALLVNNKVVGIASWGFGCGRANNPGVYTNVVGLRDWIESHTEEV